ncbi:Glycosyltransferase involved in cell wall bisynthesis [Kushneria avicenniae]|uniref:Glycosyltransferase involved in cell wall bisynthesis n=1 Tax=Kushneria avicenniae TaxID=402385 RepID=A0A1I1KZL9_9GAMM|nr:glycosyltransferase [Kushneria avicenniae]SFC65732.1 Glycosyltransferase involved in cell wall bisynthesis [Kushneria avicenniae]
MNILMFTNTYSPIVGGVSESVQRFVECFRAAGHRVLVVAPTLDGQPETETDVIRVPAMQRFNGSDFSLPVTMPGSLDEAIRAFAPDIVHSNHPFLLGDTAVRVAQGRGLPLVFTHHTLYEHYTHYVPGNSPVMQRFALALSNGYSELCDTVIAPSESIRTILRERGVRAELEVVPSGVDIERFAEGNREYWRAHFGIDEQAHVVGHVGRLAQEKNLPFLTRSVCRALSEHPEMHFMVVGDGDERDAILTQAHQMGVGERVHLTGVLKAQALIDAYHAMDSFAFASFSETQGMVVVEAMAAGLPVVALDATGVREVLSHERNGLLLPEQDEQAFARALGSLSDPQRCQSLREGAMATAAGFDTCKCADQCLAVYERLLTAHRNKASSLGNNQTTWEQARARLEAEWNLLCHRGTVLRRVFGGSKRVAPRMRPAPPTGQRVPLVEGSLTPLTQGHHLHPGNNTSITPGEVTLMQLQDDLEGGVSSKSADKS